MRTNEANVVITHRPPNERPTATADGPRKSINAKSPTKRTSVVQAPKGLGSPSRGRTSTVLNASPAESPRRRSTIVFDAEARNNSPVKRYALPVRVPKS